MSNKRCHDCLFCDVCSENTVCDNYTPYTEDGEDMDIIEAGRNDYREAWIAYTKEYGNLFF